MVVGWHSRDEKQRGVAALLGDDVTAATANGSESLLRNGVNTKQKTLLIREQMQVDKMTSELREKRELFEQRMQEMDARKQAFAHKQHCLQLKVANDQASQVNLSRN